MDPSVNPKPLASWTIDRDQVAEGSRYYVRAVLVDPQRRATVVQRFGVRTVAWASGDRTDLWVVQMADGSRAVVDPSMMSLAPIEPTLAGLHRRARERERGTLGNLLTPESELRRAAAHEWLVRREAEGLGSG